ncbi:hypothetical protein NW768_000191 [Fusarium equiseti]|uniref:Clr5 domain-containing protein n=1 Tax=Fusarium equiseti TaxID=61235 RepID=A0ABQ8RRR8_FUSEQ|nr:hypothetical protein NW768_000191 [Fusarium equiseti]
MSRAPRIPDSQWEVHKETIQSLYLEQNKTIDEIIGFMAENHQFYASKKQYIRKVTVNWKFRKNTTKEEWEQASSLVLKRKAEGKLTQLTIRGKIVPDKRSKREIRRYAPRDTFGSPVLSRIESVAVRTPPRSHRDITYFTLPWFNLQAQLRTHMLGNGLHPILDGTIASINDPIASSLSISRDQVALGGFVKSLLLSIKSGSASKSDPDMTVPAMLKSLDEQMPFSHRDKHSTELQTGRSDILGPWSRLFLSMAFLSTNNRWRDETLIKFLELAISCGLLQDLKQALSIKGPTIRLFSVALLSAALDIPDGGGFDFAQDLLQQGVNPNSAHSAKTPLLRAVASQDEGAVRLLLDYGADPFASFPTLQLHSPSQMELYDSESLAKALLDMRSSLLWAADTGRKILRTPLSFAVEAKDEVRARQLLQAGADPNLFHPQDLSPLHVAVRSRSAALVNLLIVFGADPDLFCQTDTLEILSKTRQELFSSGSICTPLQSAVKGGHLAIVERLLQAGADPNGTIHLAMSAHNEKACYERDFALTALQIASRINWTYLVSKNQRGGAFELFELLLKAGACVDTRHLMQPTALQYVCGNKRFGKHRIKIAKLLLERGADVNARPAQLDGKIALAAAAGLGDIDLVELLLKAGADVNTRHRMQPTTLQYVCGNTELGRDRIKICKLLLDWGADVNAPPAQLDGNIALEVAAGLGDVDLVELLLRVGATCSNPASVLQLAVTSGCQELVNFLIGQFPRASLSTLDIDENWAEYLEAAAESGNAQLVDMILKKCAGISTNHFEKYAINAIEAAVANNDNKVLFRLLLSRFNPNADGRAYSILNEALLSGAVADTGFRLLMSKCATLQLDLDQPPPGEPTLLWTAIYRKNMDVAQCLIVSGADVNRPSLFVDEAEGNRLETPMARAILCEACMDDDSDHLCPVDFLITSGANVDDLVDGSMTALLLALKEERYTAAEKLLLHGANPNIRDLNTRMHAFDIIVTRELKEWPPTSTLESLIDHGFQLNGEFSNGTTIQAVMKKLLEVFWTDDWQIVELVVEFLMNAGAEVNAPTTEEAPMTALQYAIDTNHEELVNTLLAAGADIHAPAFWKKGRTTLQAACNAGNLELVRSLVEQGLDINERPASHHGATALQFAAIQGHIDVAIFLLENGALINAPAAAVEGRTALQGAAEHGMLDMIFLLLENDQDDGLEERCQEAARFAEKESRFDIAQILREYRKV